MDITSFIVSYINEKKSAKLDKENKLFEKKISTLTHPDDIERERFKLNEKRADIVAKHQIETWLSDAARRAPQINLVTHAAKFTHGYSDSSSVCMQNMAAFDNGLTSASLPTLRLDTVGNAAVLDVAKLLQQEVDGDSLVACLQRGDVSPLAALTEDPALLAEWVAGFSQAFASKHVTSHKLAKQLFFPVNKNNDYHIISPLFPTSLMQVIYQRIQESRFSDQAVAIRKANKENTWHDNEMIYFPDVAVLQVGGSNTQNTSKMNNERGGRVYLFSSAPPPWQTQIAPPLKITSVFSRNSAFTRASWPAVMRLKNYLITVRDRNSDNVDSMIDEIIDILFDYVAGVQQLTQFSGWSESSQLHPSQQLWLDPYRADKDSTFREARESGDWKTAVASDFSHWLATELDSHKKLSIKEAERQFILRAPLFKQRLREMEDLLKEELR